MYQITDSSILEALRNYYMSCPLLKEGKFNIDYLGNEIAYSIETSPADPVYKQYVDGGRVYQLEYNFTSKEAVDGHIRTMIDNSFFYQQLAEWIEKQDEECILPELSGYRSISNQLITSGYLMDADADLGKYQIQLRLLYE